MKINVENLSMTHSIVNRVIALSFLAQALILPASLLATEPTFGAMSGTIYTSSADPTHLHVMAFMLQVLDGYPLMAKECDSPVDANGGYECSGLPEGSYILCADTTGGNHESGRPNKSTDSSLTFYPGTAVAEDAELVKVKAGRLNIFNFSSEDSKAYELSGHVAGNPRSVALSLYLRDTRRDYVLDFTRRATYDSATGDFSISGVTNGNYILEGRWFRDIGDGRSQRPEECHFSITVANRNMTAIMLNADAHAIMDGYLDVDGSRPGHKLQLDLRALGSGQRPISVSADADGSFHGIDLPIGTYRVTIDDVAGAYISSVIVNGHLSNGQHLQIRPNDARASVQVSASLRSGSIEGSIADWQMNSAPGLVVAKEETSGDLYTSKTDSAGRFQMVGLAPGEYDLYALPALSRIAYATRFGMAEYENDCVSVPVEAGNVTTGVALPLL